MLRSRPYALSGQWNNGKPTAQGPRVWRDVVTTQRTEDDWRAAGEQAIRDEMERRILARLARGRRLQRTTGSNGVSEG